MTTLLKGYTVLKSTPVLGSSDLLYRYRLAMDKDGYMVHTECRERGGAISESVIKNLSIGDANFIYNKYAKGI